MIKPSLNVHKLEEIIHNTVEAIEKGKEQIFEIAEQARNEWQDLEQRLASLKESVKATIDEVDFLEVQEKESRKRLMIVSRNFKLYTELDIQKAYDTARDLQVRLAMKREQEQQLIAQRTQLEKQIIRVRDILERAESLVTHVAVAMSYMTKGLSDLSNTLEDLQHKEALGVKIIMAQEEERKRVARDIHDGPAQSMSNIVLKCEIIEKLLDSDVKRVRTELKDLKGLVRNSLKEIRKIIFDLRPMSLDDLGLIPTLQRYMSNYKEDTGIDYQLSFYRMEIKIDPIIEVAIFRIIQEALNNIRKHAGASQVNIQIHLREDTFYGTIADNGVGFDVNEINSHHPREKQEMDGFGIYSMKQRAELIDGTLEISSEINKGTTVHIEIPLKPKSKEDNDEENTSYGS